MISSIKIQGDSYLVNGNMSVPNSVGNRHYREVQEWLAEGNTPEAEFTNEELEEQTKQYFTSEVQKHIDSARKVFNEVNKVEFESLANIESASSRVGYSLQSECGTFADWAYITVWDNMRLWEGTLTVIPTEEEFRTELNKYTYGGN